MSVKPVSVSPVLSSLSLDEVGKFSLDMSLVALPAAASSAKAYKENVGDKQPRAPKFKPQQSSILLMDELIFLPRGAQAHVPARRGSILAAGKPPSA